MRHESWRLPDMLASTLKIYMKHALSPWVDSKVFLLMWRNSIARGASPITTTLRWLRDQVVRFSRLGRAAEFADLSLRSTSERRQDNHLLLRKIAITNESVCTHLAMGETCWSVSFSPRSWRLPPYLRGDGTSSTLEFYAVATSRI